MAKAAAGSYSWERKPGYFLAGGRQAASEEEAKKAVEADPERLMGYTVSGPLVYTCEHGSVMIRIDGYCSHVLACKRQVVGPLFEDSYSGEAGRVRFQGGLENGKGGEPWAEWKRPGLGLYDRPGLKLYGSIEPDDLKQCSVGDCSLIASIAALAEHPKALIKLFGPSARSGLAPNGEYCVCLWDWGKKDWVRFRLDDRFASKTGELQAAFAKLSDDGEIYPMLLEKAVAIMAGGYEFCNSIMPTWALGVLTGCQAVYEFHFEAGAWTGWRPEYDGTSTFASKSTCYEGVWQDGRNGKTPRDCAAMWQAMQAWDDQNNLMCCGARAQGKSDKDDRNGVLYMHAYSVLQVKSNIAGSGQSLVQLRNPHGKNGKEPDLPWKDHDENWLRYPAVAEDLDWMEGAWKPDGLFWMSKSDFFTYFNTLYLVKCDLQSGEGSKEASICRMGCGRKVHLSKDGRRFNTCCKACACGRGHNKHCNSLGARLAEEAPLAMTMLCRMGCGRPSANGFDSCCRTCITGRGHGPKCDSRAKAAAGTRAKPSAYPAKLCKIGCGRQANPGFDTCCRTCVAGKGHGPECSARADSIRVDPSSASAGKAGAASSSLPKLYTTGEHCMFFSRSMGKWVPCRIKACRGDGAVELDVKPGCWLSAAEQAEQLSQETTFKPAPMFQVGEALEYDSASQGAWIPCMVAKARDDGAVQIDVKADYWITATEQTRKLKRRPLC
eukprot:TRINITY_DN20029_c0_g1_i1.p1 TRINITY_DN20029_c0_g1~~TRINITY_DN20029_c0_g1_i1.p1  ORF type:complete len:720 (-),score=114.06 TRINITY_DN20029_c0_g1_i1:301-2460(-)